MPDPTQPPRRFPPPWTVEETAPCFIVRDANKQALAFVYCEDGPGRRASANLMTTDEARRTASNIAKLPGLLGVKYIRPSPSPFDRLGKRGSPTSDIPYSDFFQEPRRTEAVIAFRGSRTIPEVANVALEANF